MTAVNQVQQPSKSGLRHLVDRLVSDRVSTVWLAAAAAILFLSVYHLGVYPTTWYDEGSHLHVPKTLVQTGVYADRSSEGFRYFGPTNGVGPTVMLPIAGVFKVLGIGLIQARLVMVGYLILALAAFGGLAYRLGRARVALFAVLFLVSAPGVSFLEYGRQVLGEVPGLFFLTAGLAIWFGGWGRTDHRKLVVAGLLLGLSTVTKNQYLLVIAPTLAAAWFLNWIYYRQVSHRTFLIPAVTAGLLYAGWQAVILVFLGPGTWSENLSMLSRATGGAAFVFSPELIRRSLGQLVGSGGYFGFIFAAILYGGWLAWPRTRDGQRWGIVSILILANLAWFVIASISWLRYAFPGLAFASLLMARLFDDITREVQIAPGALLKKIRAGGKGSVQALGRTVIGAVMIGMIVAPLGHAARPILFPPTDYPAQMAVYLDEHVPEDAVIETWEPEMGFLTDHRYHYPPQSLLNTAVGYIWLNGRPPSETYSLNEIGSPDYVLVGAFSSWVNLYPEALLTNAFSEVQRIGGYTLYQRK